MKKLLFLFVALFAMTFFAKAQVPVFSEDFEDGAIPSGWTVLDEDGDSYSWVGSANPGAYHNAGVNLAGTGHNQSQGYVISGSYSNSLGEPLEPDNWLVTPAIQLNGAATLSFWVCAQDASYPEEHYGVYISTTSATDATSFTLLFEETISSDAKTQTAWTEHTINLSAYNGETVYIAFRHFDCYDMFILNLDDVTVTVLSDDPMIVASPAALNFSTVIGAPTQSTVGVTAYNITTNVTATTTAPFAVSADGNSFGQSATLTDINSTLYVQYNPTAAGTDSSTVVLSAAGATDVNITVKGSAVIAATLPYACDFEDSEESSNWIITGSGPNQWVVGSAVNNTPDGDNALYVSNDNGVSNTYADSITSYSWAYRDFNFGEYAEYKLTFSFRGVGEGNYDNMMIYLGSIGVVPTSNSAPAGSGSVGPYNNKANWDNFSVTIPSSFSGARRLYLLWKNDSSDGTNPPAAIDNIAIVGTNCVKPSSPVVSEITAHTAEALFHPALATDGAWEYALCPDTVLPDDVTPVAISDTTFTLSDLEANTTYKIYVRTVCDNNEYSLWANATTFTTAPTCTSPTDLTVSQIAGTSALVTWGPAPVGASGYTFAYTVYGEDDWTTIEDPENNQVLLSGLNPLTSYEVSVTSVCEEGSAPAAVKVFSTPCLSGGDLQIGEGTTSSGYFPAYSLYNYCYTQQIYLASEINTSATEIHSVAFKINTLNTPNRHLAIYLMHTPEASNTSWLDASEAQLMFNGDVTLTLDWNTFSFPTPFEYNGTDNLAVIVLDSTGTWGSTNYWSVHTAPSGLSRYIYQDSSPYSITSVPSGGSTSTNRSDIIFGTPCDSTGTPCVAPNMFLESSTPDAITISWVPGYDESEWELQYKLASDSTWTSLGSVFDSPYTIEELTSNTLYDIRLGTACEEGYAWASLSARTGCVAFSIPIYENFDSYSGSSSYTNPSSFQRPNCWSFPITYQSAPYVATTSYKSSPNSLFFRSDTETPTTAVSPVIDEDIETLRVKFMLRAENPNYSGTFEVGVMSDPNNVNTFESVSIIQPVNSSWNQYVVDLNNVNLTGTGRYIAFRQNSNASNYYYWLDDISIILIPSCPEPTGLASQNVTAHTADLTWNSEGDIFNLYYKTAAAAEWNVENNISLTDSVYTLSGLAAATNYLWMVANICDDGTESISDQASFTTTIACPAPTSITADASTNEAVISWSGNADSYTVTCGDFSTTVSENNATITGLTPATNYTVSVTANCGDEGSSTPATYNFMTACDVISNFPYLEDFESGVLGCWSQETVVGNNPWIISSGYHYSGSYSARMGWTTGTCSRLVSPIFDLTSVENPTISFYHRQVEDDGVVDSVAVYYRSSISDEWVRIAGFDQATTNFVFDSLLLPNPSTTYQISFLGYGIYGMGINIDDIRVYDASGSGPVVITDPTVATATAAPVAQTTAQLNATITNPDGVTITAKGFKWMPLMGEDYSTIAATTSTNDGFYATLNNLTPNTDYIFHAFIVFNGDTVSGNDLTFTTLEQGVDPCQLPTGLAASEITKNSFKVTWNANNATSWNVRHRQLNGEWTSVTVNTPSHTVTGLTAETAYEVQVQADCGGDNVSAWSESLNVTTLEDGIPTYLLNSVALYPNPAKEYVDIRVDNEVNVNLIEVYDVYGKLVNTVNVVENPTRINVSGLANGMYFVRVSTDNGAVTKTFVKK